MATQYDYINDFKHKCNWWENADWENILDSELKVLSHLHFEDLRRRIHLLRYPWAGFRTIPEIYPWWWEIKYAYGGDSYPGNTYFDRNTNKFITLSEGEWRWGNSPSTSQYPYGSEKQSDKKYRAGRLFCWDGDFYADNGHYIPPQLFVNNDFQRSELGFTNLHSTTYPLSRTDGTPTNQERWNPSPWFGRYHDWDVNSGCYVVKRLKTKQYPGDPPDPDKDYYEIEIAADKWLPHHTDPKEQHYPIHCLDEDKMIWQIKNKVKPKRTTISDVNAQGPREGGRSYWMGNPDSTYTIYKIGWKPEWPQQNNIALYDGHPPVGSDNYSDKPYSEPKFGDSYQGAVEINVERGNWLLPVDATYVDNFMLYNNIQKSDGTYPYGSASGEWNPRKYNSQYEYAPISSDLFGCNGVAYEKLLKELGYHDWWWDNQTPFTHGDVIRTKYNWQHQFGNWSDMWEQIPNAVGCWRRTWQYSTGLRPIGIRWWPGEIGLPPGHIEGDSRMMVEQRHYDVIVAGYPELVKYYRLVDVNELEQQYNDAYGAYDEETDFGKYGNRYNVFNSPEGLQFVDNNWIDGTATHNGHGAEYYTVKHHHPHQIIWDEEDLNSEESKQYKLNPLMLTDMRNVMLMCKWHAANPGLGIATQYITQILGNDVIGGQEPPLCQGTYSEAFDCMAEHTSSLKTSAPSSTAAYRANPANYPLWGYAPGLYMVSAIFAPRGPDSEDGTENYTAAYSKLFNGAIIVAGLTDDNVFNPRDLQYRDYAPGSTLYAQVSYQQLPDTMAPIKCRLLGKQITPTEEMQYVYLTLGIPQPGEDQWYEVHDLTSWVETRERGLGTYIGVGTNQQVFWSWNWDSVPESVFERNLYPEYEWDDPSADCPTLYENITGQLANPSPETWHPDLDVNNNDTPNFHEEPNLREEERDV